MRYKQTAIGALWALLQPLLLAGVFTVFLGVLVKVPSERGVPYSLFALSGMVMWLFFSGAMTSSSESTIKDKELISKTYFPRILIPISAVLPYVIDFGIGFAVVLVFAMVTGHLPGVALLLLPVLVVLALSTALGLGMWLSALNVKYRDVHHVVPFIVLVGMFITPVTYPFHLIPVDLRPLYALNPMVGVIEGFRWMLFSEVSWPGAVMAIPVATSVVLLVSGFLYFQRAERDFADVI